MKITLCGSTRFRDTYNKVNVMLTLAGHVVYSVASADESVKTDNNVVYDLVHLLIILNSDAIFIIDRHLGDDTSEPYIGESTRKEIKFAKMTGKEIIQFKWLNSYSVPL